MREYFLYNFLLICFLCGGCTYSFDSSNTASSVDTPIAQTVVVRIPPSHDPNLTAGENHCVFSMWWAEGEFERGRANSVCQGAQLPNDGLPLFVNLDVDGTLTINSEASGSLVEPAKLTERLRGIFDQRTDNRVLAHDGNGVERSVALIANFETKFDDLVKLALIVEDAGATPIMLPIDGILLPQIFSDVRSN